MNLALCFAAVVNFSLAAAYGGHTCVELFRPDLLRRPGPDYAPGPDVKGAVFSAALCVVTAFSGVLLLLHLQ